MILYATAVDADTIRTWINAEPGISWIVKESQDHQTHRWRAVDSLSHLTESSHALWQPAAAPLKIPSGSLDTPDLPILDPYRGWEERREAGPVETPWFGANLPGPVIFRWCETGHEKPGSLGRSEFSWLGNRFAAIGKPAHPDALRWWRRLKRFVERVSVPVPWPYDDTRTRRIAHAFPDALSQMRSGRHADVNP